MRSVILPKRADVYTGLHLQYVWHLIPDLLPIFWTTESWKILVLAVQAGRRIFHEEVKVQRSADRVRVAAGGRGNSDCRGLPEGGD